MSEAKHVTLNVPDVSCMHCKMAIENALKDKEGVEKVDVEVPTKTVQLYYDPERVELDHIKDILEDEGYPVAGEHVFET